MNKTCSIILIALGAALIVALSPFQIALGPISYHTSNIGNRLNCYTLSP